MGSLGRIAVIALAAVAVGAYASGDTVQVYAGGKLRGAFEPRGQPYAADAPSVSVYLQRPDVKTTDGRVVTGFQFAGWPEGQGVRVQVFVLVPAKGEANAFVPEGGTEPVARRQLSSVLLAKGDEVVLGKMQELGVEPMKVRLR